MFRAHTKEKENLNSVFCEDGLCIFKEHILLTKDINALNWKKDTNICFQVLPVANRNIISTDHTALCFHRNLDLISSLWYTFDWNGGWLDYAPWANDESTHILLLFTPMAFLIGYKHLNLWLPDLLKRL